MSWGIAISLVLSGLLFLGAVTSSVDGRMLQLLGDRSSSEPSKRPAPPWTTRLRPLFQRRATRAQLGRRSAEVPNLLDLLAISVKAGLSPRLALDRAAEVMNGPLGEVLETLRRDVALGRPWRLALQRTGIAELERLALTLDRAERLGTPIGERLRDLANDVRFERRLQREERARRAPVQMLFPLVFLILPAFVLSAVVPALIVATRDIV